MSLIKKIQKPSDSGSYDEKMYKLLLAEKYDDRPYRRNDLNEGMELIEEVIYGWWKPRFLLNHNTKCAYEFMNGSKCLSMVTHEDIAWETLKRLPEHAVEVAKALSIHFPTLIRKYKNGVAMVEWQLNPDGRYYMDDDGYGMTDDKEISIYGFIDKEGKVAVKFQAVTDSKDLETLRAEAEKKAREAASI